MTSEIHEISYRDGGSFKGEFRDGIPNGWGTSVDPLGNMYCGHFTNGVPDGEGSHLHADRERYDGNYSQGLRHGVGVWFHPSGDTYYGEFFKDQRHGYGIYVNAQKQSFAGRFENGQPTSRCSIPQYVFDALAKVRVLAPKVNRKVRSESVMVYEATDGITRGSSGGSVNAGKFAIYGFSPYGEMAKQARGLTVRDVEEYGYIDAGEAGSQREEVESYGTVTRGASGQATGGAVAAAPADESYLYVARPQQGQPQQQQQMSAGAADADCSYLDVTYAQEMAGKALPPEPTGESYIYVPQQRQRGPPQRAAPASASTRRAPAPPPTSGGEQFDAPTYSTR